MVRPRHWLLQHRLRRLRSGVCPGSHPAPAAAARLLQAVAAELLRTLVLGRRRRCGRHRPPGGGLIGSL
jgi:hypothetical protein